MGQHAQMGDESGWLRHSSGLEGRSDEWCQGGGHSSRPVVVLCHPRWPSAPNVKERELATRLQLERVELLTPDLDGDTDTIVVHVAVLVRKAGVDGCGLQACRRSDLRLFVTYSQICVT